jgi:hypothetical protein
MIIRIRPVTVGPDQVDKLIPREQPTHPTEVMPSRSISNKDGPSDDPPEELQ